MGLLRCHHGNLTLDFTSVLFSLVTTSLFCKATLLLFANHKVNTTLWAPTFHCWKDSHVVTHLDTRASWMFGPAFLGQACSVQVLLR